MERQHPRPQGGDQQPEVNSYGSDDPEAQARIEQARIDAREERQRDRIRLEELVEQGIMPADDAEALIEFEHSVGERTGDDRAASQPPPSEALDEPAEHEAADEAAEAAPTGTEDTRADLARLLELRTHPAGVRALANFARSLRQGAGGQAPAMPSDPATVARNLAAGMNGPDAITLAGFEYYIRDKIRHAQPALESATEHHGDSPPSYRPHIYIADIDQRGDVTPGRWIDANQPSDELDADVTKKLGGSPVAGTRRWAVQSSEGFAGLDLSGFSDPSLISRLARGVSEHGAAFAVYVQIVGTEDLDQLDRFEDFYLGSYDSPEAWAKEVGEDLEWDRHLDRVVDPMLRPYLRVDYIRFARDQRESWDVLTGIDGRTYVFMR